jgi:hypothetical protein
MKKLNLSIPEPCHESWDRMTPDEKGKFCGSCQKSVVDFTGMSDRQLGEFFKKTTGSVCGRFHEDQLHRDIEIPKKRIPWVKYFFQFTWPAFVLFLKSCGQKDQMTGEMAVRSSEEITQPGLEPYYGIVENILPGIKPIEKLKIEKRNELTRVEIIKRKSSHEKILENNLPDPDSMAKSVAAELSAIKGKEHSCFSTDAEFMSVRLGGVVSGMTISRTRVKQQQEVKEINPLPNIEKEYSMFPNPVKAGALLTITHSKTAEAPELVQIINSAGQVISSIRQNGSEYATVFNISISSNVSEGVYFVQLIAKGKLIKTEKVVVVH